MCKYPLSKQLCIFQEYFLNIDIKHFNISRILLNFRVFIQNVNVENQILKDMRIPILKDKLISEIDSSFLWSVMFIT